MNREKIIEFFSTSPYQLLHPLKIRWNIWKSKKLTQEYISTNTVKKLHIGCGANLLKGWLNTDLRFEKNKVSYIDAGKVFPFEDATFDYIYSEHVFEHLTFQQSCNMLSESYRVLKPNGKIRIATPCLDFLFNLYKNPETPLHKAYTNWAANLFTKDAVQLLGINSNTAIYIVNNFHVNWRHQIIHTVESLSELLSTLHYCEIKAVEVGESEEEAFRNIEKHGTLMPDEAFNLLETMVIEATKLPKTAS